MIDQRQVGCVTTALAVMLLGVGAMVLVVGVGALADGVWWFGLPAFAGGGLIVYGGVDLLRKARERGAEHARRDEASGRR